MALVVDRADVEAIREHARRAYPEECCGILGGREQAGPTGGAAEASAGPEASGDVRVVQRVRPIDNSRDESRRSRYLISPMDYLEAEREFRSADADVVGFYHSHPGHPARPSAYDLEHAWPWYFYVIVSVIEGRADEMTAWVLREDRQGFDPVDIEIH